MFKFLSPIWNLNPPFFIMARKKSTIDVPPKPDIKHIPTNIYTLSLNWTNHINDIPNPSIPLLSTQVMTFLKESSVLLLSNEATPDRADTKNAEKNTKIALMSMFILSKKGLGTPLPGFP